MNKGTFADDTFEKALEAGQSMAKSGAKQIKQTFNPRKIIENAFGKGENSQATMQKELQEAQAKKPNMTPLDFAKLQQKYMDQDRSKTDALRNRLFQMVKGGEEKVVMEKKQKDEEIKRQVAFQEHEKRRREKEKQQQQTQSSANPQGKERKSIFGKKKKKGVEPSPAEIKPSTGKQ